MRINPYHVNNVIGPWIKKIVKLLLLLYLRLTDGGERFLERRYTYEVWKSVYTTYAYWDIMVTRTLFYFAMSYIIVYNTTIISDVLDKMGNCMELGVVKRWWT